MNLPRPVPAGITNNGNNNNSLSSSDVKTLQQQVEEELTLQRVNKNVYGTIDRAINIPLLITNTLAASTANAPINFDIPFTNTHVTLTAQVLGVTGAVLSALNTFIQPANRFEQHANAERRFQEISNDLTRFNVQAVERTRDENRDVFLEILQNAQRAEENAPNTFFSSNYSIGQ